ncbi:no significant blast hit [Histoplasma capsulatum var. duboisii H88]|uniref:No significant blast hit n=1 Tax=Ajellomyces capsulatus (strain H88) TaxID=544711 RepID=A0A8A1LTP1_AJEC8|nr:no significant blast hit [Histoplasma capsulatum var. duboisii H88]
MMGDGGWDGFHILFLPMQKGQKANKKNHNLPQAPFPITFPLLPQINQLYQSTSKKAKSIDSCSSAASPRY